MVSLKSGLSLGIIAALVAAVVYFRKPLYETVTGLSSGIGSGFGSIATGLRSLVAQPAFGITDAIKSLTSVISNVPPSAEHPFGGIGFGEPIIPSAYGEEPAFGGAVSVPLNEYQDPSNNIGSSGMTKVSGCSGYGCGTPIGSSKRRVGSLRLSPYQTTPIRTVTQIGNVLGKIGTPIPLGRTSLAPQLATYNLRVGSRQKTIRLTPRSVSRLASRGYGV